MEYADNLSAAVAALDNLPFWGLDSLVKEETVVMTIDMNLGFTREGALSSSRVAEIIPQTAAFLSACRERGLRILGVTDCHKPDAEEFASYPLHCLEGTAESELAEEIRGFPEEVFCKNSTNAFFAPGVQEALCGVKTVVVTGCCTDICILQFVLALKASCNQADRAVEIIVPRQLVETFDAPGHDAVLMGTAALTSMLGNGIKVVNYHA